MTVLLIAYAVVGPGAWLAVTLLARTATNRMRKLQGAGDVALPDPPPTLAIVVPARNEEADIGECVARLLTQDYPAAQLVVVDDRSTDATGRVLDDLAARDVRLKVEHVTELPDGWLGKPHALARAVEKLDAEWLLFVDSDVKLAPDAARRMTALAHARGYDLLSCYPRLECPTFLEAWLLPPLAAAWSGTFLVSLTNDDNRPDRAAANGQLLLVRRSTYDACGGHAGVRGAIVEDVALARNLKRAGGRARLQLAPDLGTTRMHRTWPTLLHGWARIFAGTSGRRAAPIVALAAFVGVGTLSAFPALAVGTPIWLGLAALHLALALAFLAGVYRAAGQRAALALLLPATCGVLLVVCAFALISARRGWVWWRGQRVALVPSPGTPGEG